jgi:hypothetical protein
VVLVFIMGSLPSSGCVNQAWHPWDMKKATQLR